MVFEFLADSDVGGDMEGDVMGYEVVTTEVLVDVLLVEAGTLLVTGDS